MITSPIHHATNAINKINTEDFFLQDAIKVEDDFYVSISKNNNTKSPYKKVATNYLQIHFCHVDKHTTNSKKHATQLSSIQNKVFLYYNTTDTDCTIPRTKATMISLFISIEKLHELFCTENSFTEFISKKESASTKIITQYDTAPIHSITISQMIKAAATNINHNLYLRSKSYELLSVFVNQCIQKTTSVCPHFLNKKNIEKIELAKEILHKNISEPPLLSELSKEVMMPFDKLKKGFKQLYGSTIYDYLFTYKMETSKKLLKTKKYTVGQVALEVGYSTSSHFIAAFKKKYGITPKKYVMTIA